MFWWQCCLFRTKQFVHVLIEEEEKRNRRSIPLFRRYNKHGLVNNWQRLTHIIPYAMNQLPHIFPFFFSFWSTATVRMIIFHLKKSKMSSLVSHLIIIIIILSYWHLEKWILCKNICLMHLITKKGKFTFNSTHSPWG